MIIRKVFQILRQESSLKFSLRCLNTLLKAPEIRLCYCLLKDLLKEVIFRRISVNHLQYSPKVFRDYFFFCLIKPYPHCRSLRAFMILIGHHQVLLWKRIALIGDPRIRRSRSMSPSIFVDSRASPKSTPRSSYLLSGSTDSVVRPDSDPTPVQASRLTIIYIAETTLDHRTICRKRRFLVHWEGYSDIEDQWVKGGHIDPEMVKVYLEEQGKGLEKALGKGGDEYTIVKWSKARKRAGVK